MYVTLGKSLGWKQSTGLVSETHFVRKNLYYKLFVGQRSLKTQNGRHMSIEEIVAHKSSRNFLDKKVVQRRHISLLNKIVLTSSADKTIRADLDYAIDMVRKYDPSGYLPGLLLGSNDEAKMGYFATRAFWVESGLRFKDTNSNSENKNSYKSLNRQVVGTGGTMTSMEMSPLDRITLWQNRIDQLYEKSGPHSHEHPTIRLLHHMIHQLGVDLSRKHFQALLKARQMDIETKQYDTVDSLLSHAQLSCGSLMNLTLESCGIYQTPNNLSNDKKNNKLDMNLEASQVYYDIGNNISTVHGISNMLRMSVPTLSSTGKIVIPADLCEKYGVRSPRYLLSALGMGDKECRKQFQLAVKELVDLARSYHQRARSQQIPKQNFGIGTSCFLPGLTAETFLNRLEYHNFDLTDRKLRTVGYMEHLACAHKLISASITQSY